MYIESVHTGMSHLALHTASPHVTCILGSLTIVLTPVLPGISEMATHHQLIELTRLILTKDRILHGFLTIFLFENQSERVLGILLCQSAMAAMQAHATAPRVIMSLWATYKLYAGRTCPSVTCIITHRRTCEDIDTTFNRVILMAEEVILIGNDGENGQILQAGSNLGTQRLIARHLRIHLIVGLCRSTDLRISSPRVRITIWIIRLTKHRTGEDIRSSGDGR